MKFKNIAISFFVIVTILPVLLGVGYALLYSFGLIGIINDGFTTSFWEKVAVNSSYWTSLLYSLSISILVVGLSVLISIGLALSWTNEFKKGLLSYIVYLPLAFPAIVIAFTGFQLFSQSGLISRLMYRLGIIDGIEQFPSLTNDIIGVGMILGFVFTVVPFFTILYTNIMKGEKTDDLINLAATLGATKKQIRNKVLLPILLKRSAFTIMLFVIFIMGAYEIPLILGRQNPSMLTVTILQKLQRFDLYQIPEGYVMSVIYILLVFSVVVVIYKFSPNSFSNDKS
jgi:putative spermidine/putrescine transport system permease protein